MTTAVETIPDRVAAHPRASADSPAASGASEGSFHVGTLAYTRGGLVRVFWWMLWGDLCLNVMEAVIPRLVPLQLQRLGASNAVIGLLTGTLFSVMNWAMNPVISTWSDRSRTRLGRRMPFMLYPSFPLAASLVAIGFAGPIGRSFAAHVPAVATAVRAVARLLPGVVTLAPAAQLSIGVLALTLAAYRFFDLFPQSVYYCLFPDVIPQAMLGRFVALFRVVATLGVVLFHYFLLPVAAAHAAGVYCGCAGLYLLAFTLLSTRVKEGTYPPPPPKLGGVRPRAVAAWFGESFGTTFYWKFFITFAVARWIYVPFNTFLILYAQRRVGLSTERFGHIAALMLLVQVPTLLALGPVLDRYHPTRVAVAAYAVMAAAGTGGFLFIRGTGTFIASTVAVFFALAVLQGTMSTLVARLMPRGRFGQFSAATAMVTEGGLTVLAWACGALLDRLGQQYLYLWTAAFAGLGLGASIVLLRAWQRLGGDRAYLPPAVGVPTAEG